MSPRRVYFLHIHKTGATSVRLFLDRLFGPDAQMLDKEFAASLLELTKAGVSDPVTVLLRSRTYVQSHGFSLPEAMKADPDAMLFSMFRDPAERLRSFYDYVRSYKEEFVKAFGESEQRGLEWVRSHSFDEYLVKRPRLLTPLNGQAKQLVPGLDALLESSGFEAAIDECRDALDCLSAVLLTEEHSRSMRLLAAVLGVDWKDEFAVTANATETNFVDVPEAFQPVTRTVLNDVHRRIVEESDPVDFALHRIARERFAKQCADFAIS